MFRRLFILIFFELSLALSLRAEQITSVLVLEQEDPGRPAYVAFMSGLRSELTRLIPGRVNFYSENLDLARFDKPEYRTELENWMRIKYAGRKLDAVVVAGSRSLDLVLKMRSALWPQAPLVLTAIPSGAVSRFSNLEKVTGVTMDFQVRETLASAVKMAPQTRHIAFVSDAVTYPDLHQSALREIEAFAKDRYQLLSLVGLTIAETKQRIASLPEDTIVYYLQINVDAAGNFYIPRDALQQLAGVSNSPIFCSSETYLDHGAVGGHCMNFVELGKEVAGQTAIAIAGGQTSIKASAASRPVFDWRQLERFGLEQAELPQGTQLLFKPPTLWEAQRELVIAAAVALVVQSGLILALLVQLRRRRRAELSLQQSEERLKLAADSASLGFWSLDKQGLNIWTTPESLQLFGLASDAILDLEGFLQLVHPQDRALVRAAVERALASNQLIRQEYRLVPNAHQQKQEERWFVSIGRSQLLKGEVVGITGVSIDITERKRLEHQSREHLQELAHISRVAVLGELSASLAHELNQPLAAILRNSETAEILLRNPQPDIQELRAIVADISKDDQRAGQVIERLRGLLKRRELQPTRLRISDLVSETVEIVQSDASARSVTIRAEIPTMLPEVMADRVHLQQVFLNLLVNGMDAVAHASERVVVISARLAGAMLELSVSDRGCGISPEVQERLFDSFFSSKPTGLGMGLSISRTIVEAHGGQIWGENNNESGGGATFRFTLPLAPDCKAI